MVSGLICSEVWSWGRRLVSLHSFPTSEASYRQYNMTDYGPDPNKDGLALFNDFRWRINASTILCTLIATQGYFILCNLGKAK